MLSHNPSVLKALTNVPAVIATMKNTPGDITNRSDFDFSLF